MIQYGYNLLEDLTSKTVTYSVHLVLEHTNTAMEKLAVRKHTVGHSAWEEHHGYVAI